MARQRIGSMETRVLADCTRVFHLRFQVDGRRHTVVLHERPSCGCGCGGGWEETAARAKLGDMLARVRAGLWRGPRPERRVGVGAGGPMPTFGHYAAGWLEGKIAGVLGDRPIAPNTVSDYRARLRHLRYLDSYPLDRIDAALCLELKAHLLAEAREIREAIAAGAKPREGSGRRRRPLGPASVRKVLDALGSILDEAVEDGLIEHNPARGRRMRVGVPKPKRTCLEMDELVYLFESAADQDDPTAGMTASQARSESAAAVAELAAQWLRPGQIAERLGLSTPTVTYHLRRLGVKSGRGYVGRRVICELLGRGGLRVGELCNLRIGDVRVHDPHGARLRVVDAKTEAGERLVEMSPALAEAVLEHLERLRALEVPSGPDAFLTPNLRGGQLSRGRVAQIVAEAASLASERVEVRGMSPLPHTTPHTLRRTYISIALIANCFDVKFVMSQVGHADSAMTMDVYAQLEQRAKRSHGTSFDRLLAEAREQIEAVSPPRARRAALHKTPQHASRNRYDAFI
ncbi:MAG: tyrosine-type recombinase/integrase [Solirubrobacterales bacterium]